MWCWVVLDGVVCGSCVRVRVYIYRLHTFLVVFQEISFCGPFLISFAEIFFLLFSFWFVVVVSLLILALLL